VLEGGETDFPEVNTQVSPLKGRCVFWNNVDKDGQILKDSLHAGMKVTKGEKWACNIWIREREGNTNSTSLGNASLTIKANNSDLIGNLGNENEVTGTSTQEKEEALRIKELMKQVNSNEREFNQDVDDSSIRDLMNAINQNGGNTNNAKNNKNNENDYEISKLMQQVNSSLTDQNENKNININNDSDIQELMRKVNDSQ